MSEAVHAISTGREHAMKRIPLLVLAAATTAVATASLLFAARGADEAVSPIYGVKIPVGYRDWPLINVGHEAANLDDFRVVLGNDVAIKAFRDGTRPFPDGTMIARLAWKYVPSAENNAVFGREQSFVTGAPTNLEFMVKDSKKYAATAGWGFAQFTDGKPDSEALHETCFSCHAPAKGNDYLFAHYAP
jgi:Cytochrome P460